MEDMVNNIRRPPHPPLGETPWLVYTHGNSRKKQIQTFCTISPFPPNNNFYIKSIPELRGKSIEGSCYGWLIVSDLKDRKIFSLYNSTSFQIINLPPLPDIEEDLKLTSCTLTSPPSPNSNCVLFLFFRKQVFSCHPTIIRHNDNWHTQQLQLDSPIVDILYIKKAVTLNGIIYCWARVQEHHNANDDDDSEDDGDDDSDGDSEDDGDDDDSEDDGDDDDSDDDDSGVDVSDDDADVYSGLHDYVVSMEVVDEATNSLALKIIPREMQKWDYSYVHGEDYLLESCGTIYSVGYRITHCDDEKIGQVKVWKLDSLLRNWIEVKSLEGRAFFLGKDCCTWCWGSNNSPTESNGVKQVEANCVYFVSLPDILSSYSLDDRSLTKSVVCPNPSLNSPLHSHTWVNPMPQHHQRLEVVQDKEDEKLGDDASGQGMIINAELVYMPQLEEDETQERESPFSKLPYDLIHVISQYMHLFDYRNFRASCKKFRAAVPCIPQCRPMNMLPLFVCRKNEDGLCQVMDPSRGDSHYYHLLRLSTDPFIVHFAKDGWLITSTFLQLHTNFFNLNTRVRGDFPPSPISLFVDIRSIGFSTCPTSPESVIVAFGYDDIDTVKIYYMQYGFDSWIECKFPYIDNKFIVGTSSLVYFKGTFHVLDTIGYLGAFEVVDGEGSWRVYSRPPIQTTLHSYYLVECNGELVGVFIGYMGIWVEVFKFNFSKEKWVKVRSLGNYSLFLSQQSSCFSTETTDVGMRNRIYLSMLKGNSIVFYSLDTQKFHIDGAEDGFEEFLDMTAPLHCFWL